MTLQIGRLLAGVALAAAVGCADGGGADPEVATVEGSSEALSVGGATAEALGHVLALQVIASVNGGTRSVGTAGFTKSADYVAARLRAAGYTPVRESFEYDYFEELGDGPIVVRNSPSVYTYPKTDMLTFGYSGSGDVTAPVQAVDLVLPPTPTTSSNSGCEASDFVGFIAGNIALLQRGGCPYFIKAQNAQDAGASAIVIFNEGNPARRRIEVLPGSFFGTGVSIPAISASFKAGNELATFLSSGPVELSIAVSALLETRSSENIIADVGGDGSGKTLVVGAHLDSVSEGPGINDNGSGVAMLLGLASDLHRRLASSKNRVRFAFWGAEEDGFWGSSHYTDGLSDEDIANTMAYLNFDMVASPNGGRFVYDGDGPPLAPPPAADGSGDLEALFASAFAKRHLTYESLPLDNRSDYRPFSEIDVPIGGVTTGYGETKTAAQAATFGGVAGQPTIPVTTSPATR